MVAYRIRQKIEKLVNLNFEDTTDATWSNLDTWPKLDGILFKSIDNGYQRLTEQEKYDMLRRFFMIKDQSAFEKFRTFTQKVVSVPKAEMDRREKEHKKARKKEKRRKL